MTRPRRRSPRTPFPPPTAGLALRTALLAGGAAVALAWPALAMAQTNPQPTADGLQPGELYMEADEVIREDDAGVTRAKGAIEVRRNGRTLRADQLIYNDQTGGIRALGNVVVINADGSFETAEEMVLDDDLKAGVALGFSARLDKDVKIAAASAARRDENVQELNKAIYTPCEICAKDGSGKTPTWAIAADRVVRDKEKRTVTYRNARFRLFGVPVLYLPVFWHADPQAPRSSGFLVPRASVSDRRGFSYEQPYYWAISPSTDLTISPQFNTKVAPLLNGQLRHRFYSGDVDIRFGYTREHDFDGRGNEIPGTNTDRSYILGRGAFRLNDKWLWGFTAERTSDDLIFDKYEVPKVYQARGPYVADDRRLISQVYAIRQDARSYLSVGAMTVQGLRPDDIDRTFPVIGPLVEAHYEPAQQIAGGRLRTHASAVVLNREQSTTNLSQRLPGLDSARVTGELDWRRPFVSSGGLRLDAFANVRADAYRLDDILTGVGRGTRSDSMSRALATVGADVSYPVFRRFSNGVVVLTPVAQIAASPDAMQVLVNRTAAGDPIYLNEDSVAFEFDSTTLFRTNKFPGYDRYEDGLRLNVAGRAAVLWDSGLNANFMVGRSFRSERNPAFAPRSGLAGKGSDWIVAVDAQPVKGLSAFARARLDADSLDVHRLETGLNTSNKYGSGFVRYLQDDFDINGVRRENLDLGGEVYLGKNLGVSVYGNRDLLRSAWVIRDFGVFYRDDCLRVDVVYRREDTIIGRLLPSESVSVRLTLATLGGSFNRR